MEANESTFVKQLWQAVRVACFVIVAIALAGVAMAFLGWRTPSLMLSVVIVLLGGLLMFQVMRALFSMRHHTRTLQESSLNAEQHYVSVLRRIVKFVEARDRHTRGRSDRIGRLAETIARRLNQSEDICQLINIAGQLHDIGLLAVPDGILNKRTTLGVDEFRTVQRHTEVSYEVLRPLKLLAPVLLAVRYHHERMNGTGYPSGLTGDVLPIEARILAVADAYDAMTHDRPHRPAMTPLEAMKELRRCSPAGYDPQCVDALAEIVNLNDLETALKRKETETAETALAASR